MSVADMLRYVELARQGRATVPDRRDLLIAHREEVRQKLADLHATLAVLDHKIDLYSGMTLTDSEPSTATTQSTGKQRKQSA